MSGIVYEIGARDADAERALAASLGMSSLLAAALRARGIATPEQAAAYLEPCLDALGDPELLPDFDKAAGILLAAREAKELVFVHGDYDTDGVTSAALFHRFLSAAGWSVHTFTPHRLVHGYGVHEESVQAAHAMGAKVFLTCDCGIAAVESLALAKQLGMKVVVTDHHLPQTVRPFVDAMVDPHLEHSRYPFAELCGAGVVFRFCEGLARRLGMPVERYRERFLEFATVGTVADVMPLTGENRTIVRHGLPHLANSRTLGFQALARNAGLKTWDAKAIGWTIGPRLNAVGRICDSAHALQLLLAKSEEEAERHAAYIEEKNFERRGIQDRAQKAVMEHVEAQSLHVKPVIMVAIEELPSGVAGLVAGRIAEHYGRPAFVLRRDPQTGRLSGSARSAGGVDLFRIIEANRHLGLGGGGHAAAAGVHFHEDAFDDVYRAFELGVLAQLPEGEFVPTVGADFEARLDEFDLGAVRDLEALEPCGTGNERLTILTRGVPVVSTRRVGKGTSVKYTFRASDGRPLDGIRHGVPEDEPLPLPGTRVDLFSRPCMNEWNGRVSVQVDVKVTLPATN